MAYFSPNEEKPIEMNLSDGRLTSVQVDGHEDRWNHHQVPRSGPSSGCTLGSPTKPLLVETYAGSLK